MGLTNHFLRSGQCYDLPHMIEILDQNMDKTLHATFAHVSQIERTERVHENLLDGGYFGTFRRRIYYVFIIRFLEEMSLEYYVRYDKKVFLLRQIMKLNEQNHFIKLMTMEV
ncbi:hypothetical protein Sarmat_00102 [Rickettsiales endosymbiont of Paramecium tredecaurelia]|uniref:hypothetical protein n=1 Tax=Candidatus Sarmatiella mevalonica TaxID=2770581 RepID=UPI0019250781|nr:hypothetical protein [Candidatus Sarmatiella mevalonica]MBL3284262.1 hypothetical protein [Candidatus Sarmatiella mevalonica]